MRQRRSIAVLALTALAGLTIALASGSTRQVCTVEADDICPNSVSSEHIIDFTINTLDIRSNALRTRMIPNNEIGYEKLHNNAQSPFKWDGANAYFRGTGSIGIGTANPDQGRLDVRAQFGTALHAKGKSLAPAARVANSASGHGLFSSTTGIAANAIVGQAYHSSGLNTGVVGITNSPLGAGVTGEAPDGADGLSTAQDLTVSGNKSFKIDHPLDPENSYLRHYCAESSEPLLTYTGNVTLDGRGSAVVRLPAYVEAIGKDFRYALAPIGSPAPNLHIAAEVRDNAVAVAGGTPGQRVSWTLTATRNDRYAARYTTPAEIAKPQELRGTYIHPALYGQPASRGERAPLHAGDPPAQE